MHEMFCIHSRLGSPTCSAQPSLLLDSDAERHSKSNKSLRNFYFERHKLATLQNVSAFSMTSASPAPWARCHLDVTSPRFRARLISQTIWLSKLEKSPPLEHKIMLDFGFIALRVNNGNTKVRNSPYVNKLRQSKTSRLFLTAIRSSFPLEHSVVLSFKGPLFEVMPNCGNPVMF